MSSLANCSCLIDADISGFIISLLYCLFLVRASESVYRYEILPWVEDRITGSPSDSDVQRRVDTWPTPLKNLISCRRPSNRPSYNCLSIQRFRSEFPAPYKDPLDVLGHSLVSLSLCKLLFQERRLNRLRKFLVYYSDL